MSTHYIKCIKDFDGKDLVLMDIPSINTCIDALGTKYYCSECGFAPSRIDCHIKGWGKAQHLKRLVRDHIKEKHLSLYTI